MLDAESNRIVDEIIGNEYWFSIDELPDDFIPSIVNSTGTKYAGMVITPETDENFHIFSTGTTRAGKTYDLVQQAMFRAMRNETVLIIDQTGAFSEKELNKHLPAELIKKYFSFWDYYSEGSPVNLLDIRECNNYKEKKERMVRMYATAARCIGDYQEAILANAVKKLDKNRKILFEDILKILDESEEKNESHRKLQNRLMAVIDDLSETPFSDLNWGEFFEMHGKPIIVISMGADTIGKSTVHIDMLLESLYTYKQRYSDSRLTIILDEFQELYLSEKAPLNVLLRKCGKYNVTVIGATQTFPDKISALANVTGNFGTSKIFRPKANDLLKVSEITGIEPLVLDKFNKGECVVKGVFYNRYSHNNTIATLRGKSVTFSNDLYQKSSELSEDSQ